MADAFVKDVFLINFLWDLFLCLLWFSVYFSLSLFLLLSYFGNLQQLLPVASVIFCHTLINFSCVFFFFSVFGYSTWFPSSCSFVFLRFLRCLATWMFFKMFFSEPLWAKTACFSYLITWTNLSCYEPLKPRWSGTNYFPQCLLDHTKSLSDSPNSAEYSTFHIDVIGYW